MQQAETEAVLERYYAALQAGDVQGMKDVVSEDIEVIYQDADGLLPWGGTWSGFDKFREFLATVAEHLVIESVQPLERLFDQDTAIIVLRGVWTSRKTDRRVEARVVNIFKVRSGKVARYQVFPDTAAFAIAIGRLDNSGS